LRQYITNPVEVDFAMRKIYSGKPILNFFVNEVNDMILMLGILITNVVYCSYFYQPYQDTKELVVNTHCLAALPYTTLKTYFLK